MRIVAFLPTTCKGQAAVGGAALPQAQKIQKYAVSFFGSFLTAHLLTFPTEQLKANDQMKWVGMMNNIRSAAEEIVLNDLIYA